MGEPASRGACVGVYGHNGSGKTTLIEALLHLQGVLQRRGKVEEGPQFLDHEPEAQRHRMSVQLSVASCPAGGGTLTLVDTPGYPDFIADCLAADAVVEAALVVVDATAGVQPGTQVHLERLTALRMPVVVAVTKEDREHAAFAGVVAALQEALGDRCQALYSPDGESQAFSRLIPGWEGDGPLKERIVEADDALLERYLEGGDIGAQELQAALATAVRTGSLVPVLPVSGVTGTGAAELLSLLGSLMVERKSDPTTVALVFKTVVDPLTGRLSLFKVKSGVVRADQQLRNRRTGQMERLGQIFRVQGKNREPVPALAAGEIGGVAKLTETLTGDVLSSGDGGEEAALAPPPPAHYRMVVRPATSGDEDRLSGALARQLEEDPGLRLQRSGRDLVLAGYGELHFEVLRERLKRKFNVEVTLSLPEVPYLETIRAQVKAEGKHKKQTGGHGQYGHVWLEISPSEQEFEFVDQIFGGAVPIQYRPAVEKGVREAMEEGVLAGYPMTRIRCVLYDGSAHPVDSSEMAFKLAGALAFKKAAKEARPVLLEPVHEVVVTVPEGYTGEVLGDLTRRRGRILGIEAAEHGEQVRAHVPLAEMLRYAVELRSLSGGRATYVEAFSHYEEVPAPVAEAVIARRREAG